LAVITPSFAALAMIAVVASRIFVAPIVRLGLLRWRFVLTRVIATLPSLGIAWCGGKRTDKRQHGDCREKGVLLHGISLSTRPQRAGSF
jgi:hypothetical protein